MNHNIYIYIFVMAAVTYLIRMLPLTLIRKEIKSTYIKSLLKVSLFACLGVFIVELITGL